MHQRHWRAILARRPAETEPATDTESVRMVCRVAHECDAGDGGAGDACGGGGCLRRACRDGSAGYEKFDGVLCFVEEVACRGTYHVVSLE